jgi:hypothetical protein
VEEITEKAAEKKRAGEDQPFFFSSAKDGADVNRGHLIMGSSACGAVVENCHKN